MFPFWGSAGLSSLKANKGRRVPSTLWLVFYYITVRAGLINKGLFYLFPLVNTLIVALKFNEFEQTYMPSLTSPTNKVSYLLLLALIFWILYLEE